MKFIAKPLTNALDVINRLEPFEYDQTQNLTDTYTAATPQSHHCVFIAQSVEQIDELKYAVVVGEIGDDGVVSIQIFKLHCNYYTRGESNTSVEPTSEGATDANRRTANTAQNHLLMNSATIIS